MGKKSLFMSFLTIAVLSFVVTGASLAYFTDNDNSTEAAFVMGSVDLAISPIKEEGNPLMTYLTTKEGKWIIENTGSKAARLRVRPVLEWAADTDIDNPGDYCLGIPTEGWHATSGEDGWYYYSDRIMPGAKVEFHLEVVLNDPWEGSLQLSIEAEAVQASNDAVDYEWPDNPFRDN